MSPQVQLFRSSGSRLDRGILIHACEALGRTPKLLPVQADELKAAPELPAES